MNTETKTAPVKRPTAPTEPTLQHSNTPEPHSTALAQLTQSSILEAIGPERLTRFFNEFAHDLQAANLVAPVSASESGDPNYFQSLAALFSSAALPQPMQVA